MRTLNADDLPQISDALSRTGWLPKLEPRLAAVLRAQTEPGFRASNRYAVLMFTVIFDMYWLVQRHLAPDIVFISGVLRFAVFTPFAVLFCILKPPAWLNELYLLGITLAACYMTIFLCLHTMEMVAQPEIYGTPLILLFAGVLFRMRLATLAALSIVCTAGYVYGVIACPMLPHNETGTLIFLQLAVVLAVFTFSVEIETRDRKVFLLTCNERIRRALVAEQNRGLLQETQTDALTGLANRRCFDETLAVAWLNAMEAGEPISLIMLDIDHFKKFNDCYGHVMGDDCLRRVAGALRAETRPTDLVARYGGEEFAVILPGSDSETSVAIAQRLLAGVAALALPHEGMGGGAKVTISLGVATARPDQASARILIEEADRNLYAAKHGGRNRISTGPEPECEHPVAFAQASRNAAQEAGNSVGNSSFLES